MINTCPVEWALIVTFLPTFKSSYSLINFSLSHAIFTSILNQHPMMDFSRFHSLPNKSHYGNLFNNDVILQVHFLKSDLSFIWTNGRMVLCVCSNYPSGITNILCLPCNFQTAYTFFFSLVYCTFN